MGLHYFHTGSSHTVFVEEPRVSLVCGFVHCLEDWWEWRIVRRFHRYERNINKWVPGLIKTGYCFDREKALRCLIDNLQGVKHA